MENRSFKNKLLLGVTLAIGLLLIIYIIAAVYFTKHFYYGSAINSISVSGMSVKEVEEQLPKKIDEYSLKIVGRDNKIEEIKGTDIDLKITRNKEISDIKKDSQNPIWWITSLFNKNNITEEEIINFDETKVSKKINELEMVTSSDIILPRNASYVFENNEFNIVSEVKGTKINIDALYKTVEGAIRSGKDEIILEDEKCYIEPVFTWNSEVIIETKDKLNDYINTNITYKFGDKTEKIEKDKIASWINVDENNSIIFNEEEVMKYVQYLADKYNTVGKSRQFTTALGNVINIQGGDYGYAINKTVECKELITRIKECSEISREPEFLQKGASFNGQEFGNTYVEIDLTRQYLWFYKNGSLITENSIVSGDYYNGSITPAGVYILKYKEKNAILRGDDYETPVTFWMPFNNGIGIHDALWRSQFGGAIYMGNGSHGCVNSPYELAESIFNNIEPGTAVVCYY